MTEELNEMRHTAINSHANMATIGKCCDILARMGKSTEVNAFMPQYKVISTPIVDVAICYDSPYDDKSYNLVLRNAFHVPLMDNNLILPFMLNEAGIQVNDKPRIHTDDPMEDDHAIIFLETKFCILLSLWGISSYFHSIKTSPHILQNKQDVYILTPATSNPRSDAYVTNGDSVLEPLV